MNIHEYQAKEILRRYGIPIPRGEVATAPAEARRIAESYGGPVMVKAQVLVGGRGKAGGVKLARTPDEAEQLARQILGMDIKGNLVHQVLVTEAADIKHEIYLGARSGLHGDGPDPSRRLPGRPRRGPAGSR